MHVRIQDGKYITKNVYLAALLELNKYVVDIQPSKNEPGRFDFCVWADDELSNLVEGFFNGTLQVEPRAFGYAIKTVKDKLYSEKSQASS